MKKNKLKKIFGVGPKGAGISRLLLALFSWFNSVIDLPVMVAHADLMKAIGVALAMIGLGLHFWSFYTLRHWWADDEICTRGPFTYFRHPMYAAWITFICTGFALYLNSWCYLLWVVGLHPIWHRLVIKEETTMTAIFGDVYKDYARKTGRFFPKILKR